MNNACKDTIDLPARDLIKLSERDADIYVKVKGKAISELKLIKHYAMKLYAGVEV
jgi:Mor family transcriptional regulator